MKKHKAKVKTKTLSSPFSQANLLSKSGSKPEFKLGKTHQNQVKENEKRRMLSNNSRTSLDSSKMKNYSPPASKLSKQPSEKSVKDKKIYAY